jgi:PAS domain S-box-containing protein
MRELKILPGPARALILAITLAGVAALRARATEVGTWTRSDVVALLALTLATIVVEQFPLPLRHETETENFSLTDAVWTAGLLLVRPGVLTFAAAAGTLIGQLGRRRVSYKVVFNVGQTVLGITAATAVFGVFGVSAPTQPRAWLAGALAMSAYSLPNVAAVAAIIALVERKRFFCVLRPSLGLDVVHAAGNTALGIMAATAWAEDRPFEGLLVVPVVLSWLAYRAWLAGMRERDRTRALYESSRALSGPLEGPVEFRPFLELVCKLFEAPAASLELIQGSGKVVRCHHGTVGGAVGSNSSSERAVGAGGETRARLIPSTAMIGEQDDDQGTLSVYRATPFSESESSVLEAIASQVHTRWENRRLFAESEERRTELADIIGATSDGIFVVSPERRVVSWNPAMERITGFSAPEAQGRLLEHVLGTRLDEDHNTSKSERRGARIDAEIVRGDGTKRWLRLTVNPLFKGDGSLRARVIVARDVTRELEAERMKSDFLATVSHELRTPLTPLKGFLSTLANGIAEDTPEARQEYYRIMINQADRLERLVSDLLEATQIEIAAPTVEVTVIDLAALIADEIRAGAHQYPARIIRKDLPEGPVFARADPVRVSQVLSNLLSNAMKYSLPDRPVAVSLESSGWQASISVKDEGEGIPFGEQDRIFERFHRVDNSSTRRSGGVGLGLFIAKELVEAMAGRLWVESRPGHGSTFSFSLPLAASDLSALGIPLDARHPDVATSV